jgi:hypothetical protein
VSKLLEAVVAWVWFADGNWYAPSEDEKRTFF